MKKIILNKAEKKVLGIWNKLTQGRGLLTSGERNDLYAEFVDEILREFRILAFKHQEWEKVLIKEHKKILKLKIPNTKSLEEVIKENKNPYEQIQR